MQGGYLIYSDQPTHVNATSTITKKLNYFIQPYGTNIRYYIAGVDKNSINSLPYGISIPGAVNTYPCENQNISKVFSDFNAWIAGENFDWYKRGSNGFKINTSGLYRWVE